MMNPLLRLERLWVYGGFLAALVILALTPVVTEGWTSAMLAVWLILPVYMIHQFEEHDDNRFARFLNEHVGKGREVLGQRAIFVINIGGVWLLNVVVIWLAVRADIGWGLIAIYATFFNAVLHIAQAVRMRKVNPGLYTSIVLFLPLTLWGGLMVHQANEMTLVQEAVALAVAIGLHLIILAFAYSNLKRHPRTAHKR